MDLNYEMPIMYPKFTTKDDYVDITKRGNKELQERKKEIAELRILTADLQEQLYPTIS